MPNWCENHLTVIDPTDELTALLTSDDGPLLSFDKLRPCPEDLKYLEVDGKQLNATQHGGEHAEELDAHRARNKEVYGFASWYDWQVDRWGTKWDPRATGHHTPPSDDEPAQFEFEFDTAWSPPTELVRWLSEQHPTVVFVLAYDEPGMDFGGYVVLRDGGLLNEDQGGSRQQTWPDIANTYVEWELEHDLESVD